MRHSGGVTDVNPASPVESIDRALVLLTELSGAGSEGLSLADLAERLGVHKTTVHRALAALRFREFVAQDVMSGRYRLGAGALTLAEESLTGDNLAALLHPALVALCADLDELVHLGVLVGAQIVYLDKVEPDRPVRVWSAVGRRMPATTTALGRALLADRALAREALEPYLAAMHEPYAVQRADAHLGAGAAGSVGATVVAVSAEQVWRVVSQARESGYAYEREENQPGIACVAVPLVRAGSSVAAVSVTAPAERMPPERMPVVAARMREVLSAHLPPGIAVRAVG